MAKQPLSGGHTRTVKPLCSTRWTVRGQAVHILLSQYETVLSSLEEMTSVRSDTGTRANGLLECFQNGKTVLGLVLATEVLGELECLSRSLQNRSQTIHGMQTAVGYVSSALKEKTSEEKLTELLEKAVLMVDALEI